MNLESNFKFTEAAAYSGFAYPLITMPHLTLPACRPATTPLYIGPILSFSTILLCMGEPPYLKHYQRMSNRKYTLQRASDPKASFN